MDISKLAKKPQLVKIELDGAEIVEKFGDTIIFYMKDHIGISNYFNFYKLQEAENDEMLNDLLRQLILNEDGSPSLGKDEVLPVELTIAILLKISDFLAKSVTKATSTPTTGIPHN